MGGRLLPLLQERLEDLAILRPLTARYQLQVCNPQPMHSTIQTTRAFSGQLFLGNHLLHAFSGVLRTLLHETQGRKAPKDECSKGNTPLKAWSNYYVQYTCSHTCSYTCSYTCQALLPRQWGRPNNSSGEGGDCEKASIVYQMLRRMIFKSQSLSKSTKVRVFRIMVMSTLLYGVKTWAVAQKEIRKLTTFQMRCLWDNLGLTFWDRCSNADVL